MLKQSTATVLCSQLTLQEEISVCRKHHLNHLAMSLLQVTLLKFVVVWFVLAHCCAWYQLKLTVLKLNSVKHGLIHVVYGYSIGHCSVGAIPVNNNISNLYMKIFIVIDTIILLCDFNQSPMDEDTAAMYVRMYVKLSARAAVAKLLIEVFVSLKGQIMCSNV